MMSLCLVVLTFVVLASANETQPRARFEYFDDYLLSVAGSNGGPSVVYAGSAPSAARPHTNHRDPASRERFNNDDPMALNDDEDMPSSGDEPSNDIPDQHPNAEDDEADQEVVRDTDIVGYFRDVPREHWSCCMLGKLAGDKGFHCHVGFYAARVSMRNHNRAHNQKMLFHGRNRIAHWGSDIMSTFGRCVERHSAEFHKCCYAASNERTERHRWYQYRSHTTPPTTTTQAPQEDLAENN